MFKRSYLFIAVAALCVAALGIVAWQATTGAATSPNNSVVRVSEDEWHMKPDFSSVPAGKVSFLVVNQGKVPHEVVILKTDLAPSKLVVPSGKDKIDETASGENVGEVEVEAGETGAATFELPPGKYVLVCNVAQHYQAGMYTSIEVKPTSAKAVFEQPAEKKAVPAALPIAPAGRKDISLVKAVRPTLVNTLDALKKGDVVGAKKALGEYDAAWNGIEVYVNFRSTKIYGELETDIQARLTKLLNDPQAKPADIIPVAEEMLAKYDEAIKMVEDSTAISPLFDDLAALRIVRGDTIRWVGPELKAGDVADAKSNFSMFMSRWADIEDTVKGYSVDAYADTEAAMAKANTAFQKQNPDAKELGPLVDDVVANYNFGVNLVNAAARNADVGKATFTNDDVQLAAGLGVVQAELKTSLTLWQAGKYQEAGDHAKRADGELLSRVSAALKAKNDADAPLKKALDAYAALADKSGDLTTARAAEKAAIQAAAIAQQVLVGQFWTDPRLQDAIKAASEAK